MAASLLGSGSALAGPATDVVKDKQSALFGIIAQPANDARATRLKALFDEMLDYARLARSSLGKGWEKLTPPQQTEFSGLLEKLVRKNYQRNLKKMLGYDIQYLTEQADGDGIVVNMKAVPKSDKRAESIELDIKVSQSTGKWLV